jgi:hypothetical protein
VLGLAHAAEVLYHDHRSCLWNGEMQMK